jgi:hypothetical protein
VLVRWRTAQETRLAGFNLYLNGAKLNGRLIRGSGALSGHRYSFLDRKAPRAGVLRYRLDAIGLDGQRARFTVRLGA